MKHNRVTKRTPLDSVSRVSKTSKVSTASSARMKEEANRAALMAQVAALQEKQELELKEAEITAAKKRLKIETALAVSTAKMQVYEEYEGQQSQISETKSAAMQHFNFLNEDDRQSNVQSIPPKSNYREKSAVQMSGDELGALGGAQSSTAAV